MRNIRDISISGIEISEAMRFTEDEEVLWAMMKTYCEDGDNKLRAMEEALDKKDLDDYAVYVHALKSSSMAIGAVRLSGRFKELELAAKRGDGIYVKGGHDSAIKEYKRIMDELRPYLPDEIENKTEDNRTLGKQDLQPLAEALKNRDVTLCLSCLASLKDKECSSFVAGSLEDIKAAIEIKDFEDADALMEDVILTMEVSGL